MAASTITRATWTNDTGTPAVPVGDGTVLNNTRLQNDVYAKIDEMFAGAGTYATFTLGGLFAAEGLGTHSISAGGVGRNTLLVRNSTAGVANAGRIQVRADSTSLLAIEMTSTTFTPAAPYTADGASLLTDGAGGLAFTASNAAGVIRFYSGGATERARFTAAGMLLLNDTTNANMTVGLTLNQGAATNEILALKQSAVAHGITTWGETDTFGSMRPLSTNGGVKINGLSAGTEAMAFQAIATTENTTKSTIADAALYVDCQTKSGTTGVGMGVNANMVVFTNAGVARFILDGDGDSHQDVGTAWTNFDDFEDHELLTALSAGVSRPGDPLRDAFGGLLDKHRRTLEDQRIVTFNEDGHHFVNWSRLHMLHVGATRQNAERLAAMERRLLALEA